MVFQPEKPQDYVLSKLQVWVFWERKQVKRKKGGRGRAREGRHRKKEILREKIKFVWSLWSTNKRKLPTDTNSFWQQGGKESPIKRCNLWHTY